MIIIGDKFCTLIYHKIKSVKKIYIIMNITEIVKNNII